MMGLGLFQAPAPTFASGTSLACFNSTAPTGWTKQTTHNDKAVRLVTGTPSSGGSVAFSTVFGKTATDAYTLVTPTDIPSHGHSTVSARSNANGAQNFTPSGAAAAGQLALTIPSTGSDGSHSHGMDIRVNYVDMIMINKD
jgi:hypothetical protein